MGGGSNSFNNNQDMLRFYGGHNMFVSSQQSASSSSSTALSQNQQDELLRFSMQFGASSHSDHSGNWRGGQWTRYDIWMLICSATHGLNFFVFRQSRHCMLLLYFHDLLSYFNLLYVLPMMKCLFNLEKHGVGIPLS